MSGDNLREITIAFPSRDEFASEWEKNISKGGIFIQVDPPPESREKVGVVIEIVDIDDRLELPGEAVHVSPQGVGIQLDPFPEDIKSKIDAILSGEKAAADKSEEDDSNLSVHQRLAKMSRHEKAALARKGAMDERNILIRDRDPFIVQNVLQNPRITIPEMIQLTKSQSLTLDMIKHITRQTEWMAVEEVRLNIVLNPKTPLPTALGLLNKLSIKNIRSLAKRPIKQRIKSAALKIVIDRGGR